ncbi:hypothetical protein R1sor_005337 [Riccia sorocarpa]|uniref:Uncharacterized protein n=1 Tax=Riccia sorocarpa TaxID=122646 RepID=A0ABD3HLI7_9MARC
MSRDDGFEPVQLRGKSGKPKGGTGKSNIEKPVSPPLKIRTEIDANPFHTLAGAFEVEMQESEVEDEELVLPANTAQEIQAKLKSLMEADKMLENTVTELSVPDGNPQWIGNNCLEENSLVTQEPLVDVGMKWGDFPAEYDEDGATEAELSPRREAEDTKQNSQNPPATDAALLNNKESNDRAQEESPEDCNGEKERSALQTSSEREAPGYRAEVELGPETSSANESAEEKKTPGEESLDLLNPAPTVVFRAQKPPENLLAVSDSQEKTGVWRRLAGGRTSRALATLANMEGLESELANLLDEDPLQVATLPNFLLNKNFSSLHNGGEGGWKKCQKRRNIHQMLVKHYSRQSIGTSRIGGSSGRHMQPVYRGIVPSLVRVVDTTPTG